MICPVCNEHEVHPLIAQHAPNPKCNNCVMEAVERRMNPVEALNEEKDKQGFGRDDIE